MKQFCYNKHKKVTMKRNQNGLLGIEGVLLLIIVCLLAFIGWYVWHTNKKTNEILNGAASQQITVKTEDPTKDWVSYSSTEGKFSLKYPQTWVKAPNTDQCQLNFLMLGGDKASAGTCASSNLGEIIVTSADGDQTKKYDLPKDQYKEITVAPVTVNRVKGQKVSGTFHISANAAGVSLADNTKVVGYVFVTGGKTYVALYQQQPSMPDVLTDFNLMVNKTLKFSAT
jgi:hypothetical protein